MRRIIGHSLLLLALLASGCNRATAPAADTPPAALTAIATLKARYGSGSEGPVREEIAVQGVVTANDRYGEFERQLVIEDASGGLVIAIELAELHHRYPIGTRVTLFCNGLTLTNYGGRIEAVADPANPYGRRGIPPEALAGHLRSEGSGGAPRPAQRTIDELGAATLDTFVRLDGVRFTGRYGTWCERDPQSGTRLPTEHLVTDAAGGTFTLLVPATASYAAEPLPAGTGSLWGIVGRAGGRYVLQVTDRNIYFNEP